MKLSDIRDRHTTLQVVIVVAVTGAVSVRSLMLSAGQLHGLVLPGAAVGAPLAALLVLLLHRLPNKGRLPTDSETDYIVCVAGLVLGLWITYWGPHKLEVLFFYWRPDLLGCAVCASAIAALVGGTRYALWVAPALVGLAVAMMPVVQVSLAGVAPTALKVGLFSGLLGALPLLVARPFHRYWILARTGAVIIVSAVAGEGGKVLHLHHSTLSLLAALSAVVVAEGVAVFRGSVLDGTIMPNLTFIVGRVIPVLVTVAIVGAADFSLPLPATATASASQLMVVPVDGHLLGHYTVDNQLSVSGWRLKDHLPENQAVMVVTTAGSHMSVLQTYPSSELIHWTVTVCPNVANLRVRGVRMTGTLYADELNGYRWEQYEWLTQVGSKFQRVTVIIASGPSGEVVPLPQVSPNGASSTAGTAAVLLADRHLICGVQDKAVANVTHRVLLQVLSQQGARSA
jgi:hypothetical protein